MKSYPFESLCHDKAIRMGTISLQLCPVMMGSAYKNKGVQLLLNSVTKWLPNPLEVENIAMDSKDEKQTYVVDTDPSKPLCA